MDSEIEMLKKEKEELLKSTQSNAESRKLKREIFLLKNPSVSFFGKLTRGTLNLLANIGDKIIKLLDKVTKPKPQSTLKIQSVASVGSHTRPITKVGKKKYFSTKIAALNDCEKGEQVYYDAKQEVYYVIKYSTTATPTTPLKQVAKPTAPKSVSDVMKSMEKEMDKFNSF